MRASYIIIFALFSNFFGWFIIEKYATLAGIKRPHVFFSEHMFTSTIHELSIIFGVICFSYVIFNSSPKGQIHRITYVKSAAIRNLLGCIFVIAAAYFFITVNFSFNIVGRGVGQFDRGLSIALRRFNLLLLPLFLFYRLNYKNHKSVKVISLIFVAALTLQVASFGDRRMFVYFFIAYIFILQNEMDGTVYRKLKSRVRNTFTAVLILCVLVMAYSFRLSSSEGELLNATQHLIYSTLSGTIGALGTGAILAEVKSYIETTTGYLGGSTFINYYLNILLPSFLSLIHI